MTENNLFMLMLMMLMIWVHSFLLSSTHPHVHLVASNQKMKRRGISMAAQRTPSKVNELVQYPTSSTLLKSRISSEESHSCSTRSAS
jgi:hypothetical protein